MKKILVTACLSAVLALTSCSNDSGETIVLTGSSTVAPVMSEVAPIYEKLHPGIKIEVQTGGSSRGISDALSGLATFGMISRNLKPEEAKLTAHRIAMDGVGVIVHKDNPVSGFTKRQLIDIYTKKVTNWSAFGGADKEIVVANKAEGRATLEVFLGYTGLDSADIKADIVVGENQQAVKTVAGNADAIAYVSIGTAAHETAAGTPVKLVDCDGIAATTENVASGIFPITRPLQVVTFGEIRPEAKTFLHYVLSPEINEVILSNLYVPIAK